MLTVGLCLVLRLVLLNAATAAPPSAEEVVDALKTWDQAFEKGVYVSGVVTLPPSTADSDSLARLAKSRFTCRASSCAIESSFLSLIPGTSRPAIEGDGSATSKDSVLLRHAIVFDDVMAGVYQKAALDYSETGVPDPEGKFTELVYLYMPDDYTPAVSRYQYQWAMGRGFSRHIKEITSVTELEEGGLRVVATGVVTANWPGRWELRVDPSAAFLVREARFFENGEEKPQFKVVTEGVLDAGDWIAARAGSYVQPLIEGRDDVTGYQFESIEVLWNEDFFKEVRAIFDREWPDGTWILDRRGAKEKNTIVGSIQPPARQPVPPPKENYKVRIFIIANILLAIVLLVLGIRGRRHVPSNG